MTDFERTVLISKAEYDALRDMRKLKIQYEILIQKCVRYESFMNGGLYFDSERFLQGIEVLNPDAHKILLAIVENQKAQKEG